MNVILNEAAIKNLFSILDQNNDDEIAVNELEAVFAKYLGSDAGGKQKKVDRLEELERHIPRDDPGVTEAPAFQKKGPLVLDVHPHTEVREMEEIRVKTLMDDIMCGNVEDRVIGGELVLKINDAVNLPTINGKEKLAFAIYVMSYDRTANPVQATRAVRMPRQDPGSGKLKTTTFRIPMPNTNMVSRIND